MVLPYRNAIIADAEFLAPRLRQADLDEIKASSGDTPVASLERSIRRGVVTLTMIDPDDGEPVGIFGLVETPEPDLAAVWAMATPKLFNNTKLFMRESHKWLEHVNDVYHVLYNYVDARNVVHIKWLQSLGFICIKAHENYGVERRQFIEFVRIK